MKYTQEITINKPLEEVVRLFDNPDNMGHWMEGLVSFEHLSGEPGKVGAKSKLKFKMGKRDLEMVETILVRDLPREFSGTYEAKGVFNVVKNYFEAINENQTKYTAENEFQFSGFMKLFGWLMPGAFKKQSFKYQEDFKRFAEAQS